MSDIFKRPVVIVIVLVAVIAALIWSYVTKSTAQKKASATIENSASTAIDLTSVDPADFDEVIRNELTTANNKALEADSANQLAAIEINLPSLQLNAGQTRYIYASPGKAIENWTITFDQKSGSFLRASIPKADYLGVLPPMNTSLWKFNYVTAIQIAEKSGGLEWRNNNGLSNIKIVLKHGGEHNWLLWFVDYKCGDAAFSKAIDANSGKIIDLSTGSES